LPKRKKRPAPPPMPYVQPEAPMDKPEALVLDRGGYERRQVEQLGRRIYVNTGENLVSRLLRLATITRQQAEACFIFERDHLVVWGSHGARDSCVLRIGGEEYETDSMVGGIIRSKARMHAILNRAGPGPYALLRQVAVYGERLGKDAGRNARRYAALRAAMDAAADVYGVPE
jgi:hypothetical protein